MSAAIEDKTVVSNHDVSNDEPLKIGERGLIWGGLPSPEILRMPLRVGLVTHVIDTEVLLGGVNVAEIMDLMSTIHRSPTKDGGAIIPADFRRSDEISKRRMAGDFGKRDDGEVISISMAVHDHDRGGTIENTLICAEREGWLCIAVPSYNYGTTESSIDVEALTTWCEKNGRGTVPYFDTGCNDQIARLCADFLIDDDYCPELFEAITLVAQRQEKGRSKFVISHAPIEKHRSYTFFTTPFEFPEEPIARREALRLWNVIYHGIGQKFGGRYDRTCENPSRLYFLPRAKRLTDDHCARAVNGGLLDWRKIEMPESTTGHGGRTHSSDDTANTGSSSTSGETLETPWLKRFLARYGDDLEWLEIARAYLEFRGQGSDPTKAEFACPNEHNHRTPKENDRAFAVFQGPDGGSMYCQHATCQEAFARVDGPGQDRGKYLDLIIVQNELIEADLRQFSETARKEDEEAADKAAQQDEVRKAEEERHAKAWGDSETLAGDKDALAKAIETFKEAPSDDRLTRILMALATLSEMSTVIGLTCSAIRPQSGHDLKTLKGFVSEFRKHYEVSQAATKPNDLAADHADEDIHVGKDEFTIDLTTGRPYPNQRNIKLAIRKLGVELSFNQFSGVAFLTRHKRVIEIDDSALTSLWLEVDRKFKFRPGKEFFYDVADDVARRKSFHPVREYLQRVQVTWDKTPRIETFLIDYCGAPDTLFNRAMTKLWFVAAVRRIREPGCKFDEMPILESPQGLGKSTLFEALAGGPEYFTDSVPMNADPKVIIELTRGKWIVEVSDMQGHRKTENEAVKAMLSRRVDRSRLAYGRLTANVPRQFVFVGTCNYPKDGPKYLSDLTGNRRFWPAMVSKVDLDAVVADRDQLWAEAAVMEATGMSIRLDPALWGAAAEVQEDRRARNRFVDKLEELFDGVSNGRITTAAVYDALDLPSTQRTAHVQAEVTDAMAELGWTKKTLRIGNRTPKGYAHGNEKTRFIVKNRELPERGWIIVDEELAWIDDARAKSKTRGPDKDPSEWVTGGEPMTEKQSSLLKKLCKTTGKTFNPTLTKAEAFDEIDRLFEG